MTSMKTSKKTLRILVAKDKTGQVTAIGVAAANLGNTIRLKPPEGGTVEEIKVPRRSKIDTAPLTPKMVEEILKSGQLKPH
jgi:hypothetical protein